MLRGLGNRLMQSRCTSIWVGRAAWTPSCMYFVVNRGNPQKLCSSLAVLLSCIELDGGTASTETSGSCVCGRAANHQSAVLTSMLKHCCSAKACTSIRHLSQGTPVTERLLRTRPVMHHMIRVQTRSCVIWWRGVPQKMSEHITENARDWHSS